MRVLRTLACWGKAADHRGKVPPARWGKARGLG